MTYSGQPPTVPVPPTQPGGEGAPGLPCPGTRPEAPAPFLPAPMSWVRLGSAGRGWEAQAKSPPTPGCL